MTDDMLGPSPMHITYSSYVYDGFCIYDGPIFLVPLSPSYPSSPVLHILVMTMTQTREEFKGSLSLFLLPYYRRKITVNKVKIAKGHWSQ